MESSTAAGCDYGFPALKIRNGFSLCIQEMLISPAVYQILQTGSIVSLDQDVYVQKIIAQEFGKNHANCAFPAARHTDQNDIVIKNTVIVHSV